MKISILCINFRTRAYLPICMKSLKPFLEKYFDENQYEWIIVNYDEESLTETLPNYPGITVIQEENKGFGHGINLASEKAQGETLLIVNPDLQFQSFPWEKIEPLLAQSVIVGGKLLSESGAQQISHWAFPAIMNEFLRKHGEKARLRKDSFFFKWYNRQLTKSKYVNWMTGALLLVPSDIFHQLQGFDSSFFMFYEDVDLCYRARQKGIKTFYLHHLAAIHAQGVSYRSERSKHQAMNRKSRELFYKKHYHPFALLILRSVLSLTSIAKFFLKPFQK